MKFSHPLARTAKVWPATARDGRKQNVLVIVTTLELEPAHKKFRREKVERLAAVAKEYASANMDRIDSFLFMNPPKEWEARRPEVHEPVWAERAVSH